MSDERVGMKRERWKRMWCRGQMTKKMKGEGEL